MAFTTIKDTIKYVESIKEYKKIINSISQELIEFDKDICICLSNNNVQKTQITPIIKEFLLNKGKRIRPVLTFLFAKAISNEIKDKHCN